MSRALPREREITAWMADNLGLPAQYIGGSLTLPLCRICGSVVEGWTMAGRRTADPCGHVVAAADLTLYAYPKDL